MAHIIPDNRDLSPPELKFLTHIKNDKQTKDWFVFPALPLKTKTKKYNGTDIDFLILAPQLGFIFIEIKGNYKIEDGKWSFTYDGKNWKEDESPLDRINDTKFAFARYLKERFDKKSPLHQIVRADFVVFPKNDFNSELPLENSKLRVIDKNDLQRSISIVLMEKMEILNEKAKKRGFSFNAPDKSQCKIIKNDIYPDTIEDKYLRILTDETVLKIEQYTEDQKEMIRFVQNMKKMVITGGASTGKSIMAQTMALKYHQEGKSVLYLTPTIALEHQTNQYLTLERDPHGRPERDINKNDEWREEGAVTVAKAMHYFYGSSNFDKAIIEYAKISESDNPEMSDKYKADVLIVDEIQDYLMVKGLAGVDYLCLFEKMVKGGFENGLFIFCGDITNQVLYKKKEANEIINLLEEVYNFNHFTLETNCRNPKRVLEHLTKESNIPLPKMRFTDNESPAVKDLRYDNIDSAVEGMCKEIKSLFGQGIKGDEIAVVSDFINDKFHKILTEISEKYNIAFQLSHRGISIETMDGFIAVLDSNEKYKTISNNNLIPYYTVNQYRGCEANWVIIFGKNKLSDTKKYIAYTRAKAGLITISRK